MTELRLKILTNELGDLMLDSVAPIYDNSALTLYTFQAFGKTLEKEMEFIEGDFIKQMFPQTATWGLDLWEDEYGIVTDASKTIEQRRHSLMAVMYKSKPMTPYNIKQLVYFVTGFDNEIEENTAPNTITIRINGYVKNINELRSVLDKKLPAHLNYLFKMEDKENVETISYYGIGVHEFETINVEVTQYVIEDTEQIETASYSGIGVYEIETNNVEVTK